MSDMRAALLGDAMAGGVREGLKGIYRHAAGWLDDGMEAGQQGDGYS